MRFQQLPELFVRLARRLLSFGKTQSTKHRHRAKPPARCWFERLEAREVFNATYHGGAIIPHIEAQAVFLGSQWSSNATLETEAVKINDFLSYAVQSPYMDMLTDAGYNVGQGSVSAFAK